MTGGPKWKPFTTKTTWAAPYFSFQEQSRGAPKILPMATCGFVEVRLAILVSLQRLAPVDFDNRFTKPRVKRAAFCDQGADRTTEE